MSVSPSDGSTARSAQVKVVVHNASTSVKEDSVKLMLNGEAVDVSVSKDGDQVTISYDGSPIGPNTAVLSYGESDGSGNQIASGASSMPRYMRTRLRCRRLQGAALPCTSTGERAGLRWQTCLATRISRTHRQGVSLRVILSGHRQESIEVQPAGSVWDNYG